MFKSLLRNWAAKCSRQSGRLLLCALISGPVSLAYAQDFNAPTREELNLRASKDDHAPGASKLTVDGGIERGPCPLADAAYAGLKVRFSSVRFNNLNAVPADALTPAWTGLAGQDVPVSSLCEVRDRAATILRQMGYLAAVQVPPQKIENGGEVQMDVLVAKLVELQLRGDAGHSEKVIAAHLNALTKQPWFNTNDAERHLLLARDLPGFDVRLTLRPTGTVPGEVVGDVVVTRRPVELVVAAQNLGSRAVGREGGFAQIVLNDVTGMGDHTSLSLFNSYQLKEQTVVQVGHEFAIGNDGLRLGGNLIYGHNRPDIANGNFSAESWIGRVDLSYPLVRRQALSLHSSGGLEIINQDVDFAKTPLSKDRMRVLFGQLDLAWVDRASLRGFRGFTASEPRWRIGATLEARQGVAALGASNDCSPISDCLAPHVPISRLLGDPTAFLTRFDVRTEYRPVPAVTIAAHYRGQYSSSALLGFEQFSLGNYSIGRGFDPAVVQGDSGIAYAVELRLGRITPSSRNDLAMQPFVFFDNGWAWTHKDIIRDDPYSVHSAGGGVRARWGDRAELGMTLAVPLKRAGGQNQLGDARLLFTLTTQILPWDPS